VHVRDQLVPQIAKLARQLLYVVPLLLPAAINASEKARKNFVLCKLKIFVFFVHPLSPLKLLLWRLDG
jgi:hypothetical protein